MAANLRRRAFHPCAARAAAMFRLFRCGSGRRQARGVAGEREADRHEHGEDGDELVPDPPPRQRQHQLGAVDAAAAHGEREAELGIADDGERQEEQRRRPAPPRCRGRSRARRAWRGRSRRAPRSGRRGGRGRRRCAPRRGCASASTRRGDLRRAAGALQHVEGHAEGAVAGERPDDHVQHPVPDALEAGGGKGLGSRALPDAGRAVPSTAAARRRQPAAAPAS